jgi:hypothetical protein
MKRSKVVGLSALFLGLIMSLNLFAQNEKEIQKVYDKKKLVKLKLVLGDCRVEKSSDGKIHVDLVYTYDDDNFEPRFAEKARSIEVRERFHGDNPRGYAKWTISVPNETKVDFKSATGDFYAEGVTAEIEGSTGTGEIEIVDAKGQFDISTGTGNIEVTGSEGEFDLSSGTGDVWMKNSTGNFDASSGTGDAEATDITIEYDGEFSSGTGNAEVTRPNGDDFDLSVSSGTDDATLNMAGSPIDGYFEFRANARRGRISSPIKFDDEEEYSEGDNDYVRKSFTKGKKSRRFYIKTGTGRAKLTR